MLVSWKVSLVYVGVVSVILQSKDSYSIKLVPLEFKHFSIRVVGSVERVPAELEEEEGTWKNGFSEISLSTFEKLPPGTLLDLVSGENKEISLHGREAIVILGANGTQSISLLSKADRRKMIFMSLPISTSLPMVLGTVVNTEDFQFPSLDSNVFFLQSWNVTELYNVNGKVFFQDVPVLRNNRSVGDDESFTAFYTFLNKNKRRSNFQRQVICAVSMDVHGYELATDFDDDNSTETKFVGGFEVAQYWFLRDSLNFTEGALKGTGFIREGPNKTLTGMAVPINKGEVDVGISATEFIEYRISGPDGITYLQPTFSVEMMAFFKQPPASSIRDVFTSAFSWGLWGVIFLLWVTVSFALYFAYVLYGIFSTLHPNDVTLSTQIYMWATGATCQQGFFITPVGTSARIIFFSGWFFGLLCYTAFSAQLVSILAVQVVPVKSFADLLRSEFFICNDGHIPTTKFYVQGLQEQGTIQRLPESRRNVEIDATIGKLIRDRVAMISVTDSFYPIVQKEGYSEKVICDTLSEVRVGVGPIKMSMIVKRGSPLRDIFNTRIISMLERGVRHRLMRAYLIDTSVQCLQESSGVLVPIAPKDLFTAYGLLTGGASLAFCVLLAEKTFSKLGNRLRHDDGNEGSRANNNDGGNDNGILEPTLISAKFFEKVAFRQF